MKWCRGMNTVSRHTKKLESNEKMVFNAPMPEDFKKIVDTLDKKNDFSADF